MSKEKIIKRILNSIDELKDISEDINLEDGLNSLEIDIALTKANLIVQEFQLLKNKHHIIDDSPIIKAQSEPATQIEQPVFEDPQPEETEELNEQVAETEKEVVQSIEQSKESLIEAQEEAKEEIAHAQESITASQEEVQEEIKHSQEEVEESVEEEIEEPEEDAQADEDEDNEDQEEDDDVESPKMVGERFQVGKSLNDLIKGAGTLDQKIAHSPINSLQSAIGINDRFLFIREIFDNDADKYKETITALDEMENIKQAVDYLSANFKIKKTETSLKFVELIKRRFAK